MPNCQSNAKMIKYIVFYILFRCTKPLDVDYCRLPCRTNNKTVEHIMCTLQHDCSVGPECKVKTKFEYTGKLKSFTLDMHNYYRNKVAFGEALGQHKGSLPQAADMLEMVWDEELAYFAQCYANKCILQYDKCRQSSAGEDIGQLIFIRVSVNPKSVEEIITEMLESVFHSSKVMPLEDVEHYRDNKYTKQFTQLVWAKTNRVGCGMTKLLEDLYAFFMVCNYGRAGNIEGEKVYTVGSTCSYCPEGRRCSDKFFGLCAASEDEKRSSREKIEVLKTLERMINTDDEESSENPNNYTLQLSTEAQPSSDVTTEDAPETLTHHTGVRIEVTMSEIPTFESSYLSYEEITTDEDSQMIEDLSTRREGLVMFERLVSETASDSEIPPTTSEVAEEEVPLRSCKVKRRYNWPVLESQDSGAPIKSMFLCYILTCSIIVNLGISTIKV